MEAIAIAGIMNAGVIIIGGAVNFAIHKWNRSKLKTQFAKLVDELKVQKEEIVEIRNISINASKEATPADKENHEPDNVSTPSEYGYSRVNNPRKLYYN